MPTIQFFSAVAGRAVLGRCVLALAVACAPPIAFAQQPAPLAPPDATQARAAIEAWGFDPSVLVADGRQLLLRAPDPAVDGLFQAFLASARSPEQPSALCGLFEPQADRSLAGLNALAAQLDEATRQRYVNAVALLFVAAAQSPPQPFDPDNARHLLRQAGVRASILHDGFVRGLNGDDADARCRSIGLLLESLQGQPLAERAAVTRLLLIEGLNYVTTAGAAAAEPLL